MHVDCMVFTSSKYLQWVWDSSVKNGIFNHKELSLGHCLISASVHGNFCLSVLLCVGAGKIQLPGGKGFGHLTSCRTARWIVCFLQAGHFICTGIFMTMYSWKCGHLITLCKMRERKGALSYMHLPAELLRHLPQLFVTALLHH